jgi:hypothetical protein
MPLPRRVQTWSTALEEPPAGGCRSAPADGRRESAGLRRRPYTDVPDAEIGRVRAAFPVAAPPRPPRSHAQPIVRGLSRTGPMPCVLLVERASPRSCRHPPPKQTLWRLSEKNAKDPRVGRGRRTRLKAGRRGHALPWAQSRSKVAEKAWTKCGSSVTRKLSLLYSSAERVQL